MGTDRCASSSVKMHKANYGTKNIANDKPNLPCANVAEWLPVSLRTNNMFANSLVDQHTLILWRKLWGYCC